jgi:hypothetical protein
VDKNEGKTRRGAITWIGANWAVECYLDRQLIWCNRQPLFCLLWKLMPSKLIVIRVPVWVRLDKEVSTVKSRTTPPSHDMSRGATYWTTSSSATATHQANRLNKPFIAILGQPYFKPKENTTKVAWVECILLEENSFVHYKTPYGISHCDYYTVSSTSFLQIKWTYFDPNLSRIKRESTQLLLAHFERLQQGCGMCNPFRKSSLIALKPYTLQGPGCDDPLCRTSASSRKYVIATPCCTSFGLPDILWQSPLNRTSTYHVPKFISPCSEVTGLESRLITVNDCLGHLIKLSNSESKQGLWILPLVP